MANMNDLISVIQMLQHHFIVVMMAVFIAIVLWAYWPPHKQSIEDDGQIPFRDEV